MFRRRVRSCLRRAVGVSIIFVDQYVTVGLQDTIPSGSCLNGKGGCRIQHLT